MLCENRTKHLVFWHRKILNCFQTHCLYIMLHISLYTLFLFSFMNNVILCCLDVVVVFYFFILCIICFLLRFSVEINPRIFPKTFLCTQNGNLNMNIKEEIYSMLLLFSYFVCRFSDVRADLIWFKLKDILLHAQAHLYPLILYLYCICALRLNITKSRQS